MSHKYFPVDSNGQARKSTNLLSKMDETLNAMEQDLYPKESKAASKRLSTLSEVSSASIHSIQQHKAAVAKEQLPLTEKALPLRPLSSVSISNTASHSNRISILSERPSSLISENMKSAAASSPRAVSISSISDKSEANSFSISKPFRLLGFDAPAVPSHDILRQPDDLDIDSPNRNISLSKRLSRSLGMKDTVNSDITVIPNHVPITSKALKTLGVDVFVPPANNKRSSMMSKNFINLFSPSYGSKRMSAMSSMVQNNGTDNLHSTSESSRLSVASSANDNDSAIPARRSSLSVQDTHVSTPPVFKQSSQSALNSKIIQEATPANSDIEDFGKRKLKVQTSGAYSEDSAIADINDVVTVAHTNDMRKFVSGYLGKTPVLMEPLETSFFVLTIEGFYEFKGHEDHHKAVSVILIDKSSTITIPNPNEFVIQLSTQNGQQTDTCYLTCPGKPDMDIWVRGFTNAIHLNIYSKLPLPPSPDLKEDKVEELCYKGEIVILKRLISDLIPVPSTDNMDFVKSRPHEEDLPAPVTSALLILNHLANSERKKN